MPEKPIDLQAVHQAEERLKKLLEEHPELRDPERQEALAAWLTTLEEWRRRTPPMAKKGRPFTYQSDDDKPVTISLRIPKELHTRLERYRKQHRQSLSELVKDGIEMRLETEADPRNRRAGSTPASEQDQEGCYGNTEDSTPLLDGARILREMREGFAQIRAMVQTLERQAIPGSNGSYYGNTATASEAQEPRGREQDTVPDIDRSRYFLGKLCPSRHNYQGTGQSLRHLSAQQPCVECKRARTQRWREKGATP
jgi:hypothetical protein